MFVFVCLIGRQYFVEEIYICGSIQCLCARLVSELSAILLQKLIFNTVSLSFFNI